MSEDQSIEIDVPVCMKLGEYCNHISVKQDGGEAVVDFMLVSPSEGMGELLFRMRCTPQLLANLNTFLSTQIKGSGSATASFVDLGAGMKTLVVTPKDEPPES